MSYNLDHPHLLTDGALVSVEHARMKAVALGHTKARVRAVHRRVGELELGRREPHDGHAVVRGRAVVCAVDRPGIYERGVINVNSNLRVNHYTSKGFKQTTFVY